MKEKKFNFNWQSVVLGMVLCVVLVVFMGSKQTAAPQTAVGTITAQRVATTSILLEKSELIDQKLIELDKKLDKQLNRIEKKIDLLGEEIDRVKRATRTIAENVNKK